MRLNSYLFITSLCVLFTACGVSCAFSEKKTPKPEKVQVREPVQIVNIGMQAQMEYVVREKIDLKGKQVNVPAGVTISFKKGGSIVNGTLNGNGTRLNSKTENVVGVKLKGTWCVDKVSDLLFSREHLSDTEIINNLNAIQSDTMANEVTIHRDYSIAIARSGGAGLLPSSHSTILLKGSLTLDGNNYKSYQIIDIKHKEDVTIKGGRIVGDVGRHSYIEGSSSEWGMGVNIQESQNVTLSDLYIIHCTGDGIYISGGNEPSVGIYDHASRNVAIRNVTCDDNRRQGLSVIHVDGLTVRDCSFVNTGRTEFTAPGSGIDIEPNVSNGRNMSVRNVVVDNCAVLGNKGSAIATNNTYETDGLRNYANILFSNCRTDGLLKAQSDDMTFRNCTFKEIRFAAVYAPTHITMEDCTISGGYGIILYVPSEKGVQSKDRLLALDFKGCTISTTEGETRTNALISCYKSYVPNLEYVKMENCHLTIPRAKSKTFKLTDYDFKGKLKISSSTINMEGSNLEADGVVLDGNKIRCAKVVKSPKGMNNKIISIE